MAFLAISLPYSEVLMRWWSSCLCGIYDFCTTSKRVWLGVLRPNVHFKQALHSFSPELFCSNDFSSDGWTTRSSRRLAFSRREGTTKASGRAAFSLTWHDDHEEDPRIWEWKYYRRTSIGHSFDIGSENGCFGVGFPHSLSFAEVRWMNKYVLTTYLLVTNMYMCGTFSWRASLLHLAGLRAYTYTCTPRQIFIYIQSILIISYMQLGFRILCISQGLLVLL